MSDLAEEAALYRVFGDADLLLYIGISNDFGRRWKQHAKNQPWWDERRRMTVEMYGSRPEAEAAEEAAIKAEKPKHNIKHSVTPVPAPRRAQPAPLPAAAGRVPYAWMSGPKLTAAEEGALPATLSLRQAARITGMGTTKAYELARTGKFPCRLISVGGRAYRVATLVLLSTPDIYIDLDEMRALMITRDAA